MATADNPIRNSLARETWRGPKLDPSDETSDDVIALNATDSFLVKTATMLHRYGTPAHRLERVMLQLSSSLGVVGVFLYTPTALVISITGQGTETTYLRRVDSGALDVDKLIRFDETLELLEAGRLSLSEADRQIDAIAGSPPPYSGWVTSIACAMCCAMVAIFFQGSWPEIAAAALLGWVVTLLEWVPAKLRWEPGLLEPVAGFVATVGALAIAKFIMPIDDRVVTLAALIVMVPGLKITVAMTELAVGHLSAGVARLAGGCVSLLTMIIGVALGLRVALSWRTMPDPELWQLPAWSIWVAICIAPVMFAILFRARWPQWPVILVISIAGFAASLFGGQYWGIEVGAFCGACSVGVGSNLYARLRDRPALVTLIPGIIVLVPGSIGYRSLSQFLEHNTMAGIDSAFNMLIVAVALAGGILTANALLPPKSIL